MLSYHLLRNDLPKEQRYLQRWAKRGYQLTSAHGSWHHFEKMAKTPASTLQVVGVDADPEASTVFCPQTWSPCVVSRGDVDR